MTRITLTMVLLIAFIAPVTLRAASLTISVSAPPPGAMNYTDDFILTPEPFGVRFYRIRLVP